MNHSSTRIKKKEIGYQVKEDYLEQVNGPPAMFIYVLILIEKNIRCLMSWLFSFISSRDASR